MAQNKTVREQGTAEGTPLHLVHVKLVVIFLLVRGRELLHVVVGGVGGVVELLPVLQLCLSHNAHQLPEWRFLLLLS